MIPVGWIIIGVIIAVIFFALWTYFIADVFYQKGLNAKLKSLKEKDK